ncbi:glycosyltransferase [Arcobacter porcinus]|uniref:glycosyltransferase n=1 Tax=Arcobacter porcinus TaxID=1935204 RepID=UPI00081F3B91|nr:glycosyltransferase [Arcobacter porcinus]OCL83916.1 4-alpha-N-acetylgalactosaminyltransferase [Arcobacter porcinus]
MKIVNKGNIALICLSPNFGGMEIDAIKLAKKLSLHSKIVLIAKKDFFIAQSFNNYFLGNKNVFLETIKFKSSLSFNIINRAREIIIKNNIKNVVFFGASELKSLYFSFLGLDINLIVRHGTTKSTPKKDLFHKLIYSKVNYHVSICKHIQKNVDYIIPFGKNSKSILIYSSVKNININKKEKNAKLTLLHTGRIADGKGQIDAIKACSILVENNIDFIFYIVGGYEKDYEKEFLQFYEKVNYKDKIVLVGFSNKIEKYLEKADIYLFPSYGEGLSNSFLEALSSGLSCISYSNTSFPELKELGLDFEIVENKNIEKLKETLLKISKKETIFDIEKNKKIINDYFSEEKEIKQYLEILV